MTIQTTDKGFDRRYERLTADLRGRSADWLLDVKAAAMAEFRERGYPTAHDEEWRFTPVAPIVETEFVEPGPASEGAVAVPAIGADWPVVRWEGDAVHLPSAAALPAGVTVARLSDLAGDPPQWLRKAFGRTAPFVRHPFSALNTALFADAAVIHVEHEAVIDTPILVAYATPSSENGLPAASHPRTLLVVGRNAKASLVEWYGGRGGDVYLTNAVTEVVADANASVSHYRLQDESAESFHVGMLGAKLAQDARYFNICVSLGGSLSRLDAQVGLDGEGVECTLDGLYVVGGRRLMDHHTFIDHATPNCASHEIYKGVLSGSARGVFNGKILVRQDAQKTDAKQVNQALLLSDEAQINTKPQLEIYADDVKCTHGATVGQLDRDALFYLRQRGIGLEDARRILIHAFAGDIVDRIELGPLRDMVSQRLLEFGV